MSLETNPLVLELTNIHLWRNRPLLTDIHWTVRRGEHWVVLGRNGAGKTLLLKILAGYLWPSQGEVRLLGARFGGVDLRTLRQDIGWVSSALTEKIPDWDTTLEVVLSGAYATFGLYQDPPADLVSAAENLLTELGMAGLADQKFSHLSAGEKQRVLLARSRLPRPRLLILDEPLAGLDLAAREKFLGLLHNQARDPEAPTMLMVTHRVEDIVSGFTHGLLLHQGRALASGPLSEVLTDDLLSRALEIPVTLERSSGRYRIRAVAFPPAEQGHF